MNYLSTVLNQENLRLTPSTRYLKIIGKCSELNGKRWKEFVQVNLPRLEQFQFDVLCYQMAEKTRDEFPSIIEIFRSPIWIEDKKWFVGCQCVLHFV